MIKSVNTKEDERLLKKRLQSNAPQKIDGYDVQFDESVPLASRQAFATKPTAPAPMRQSQGQAFRGSAMPTSVDMTVAPPKTMGDMLRYNREMKAKRIQADIAQKDAQSKIAAFSANATAEHLKNADINAAKQTDITGRHYIASDENAAEHTGILKKHYAASDEDAALRTKITGEHYTAADKATADRNAQLAKVENARQALEERNSAQDAALKSAQTELTSEKAKDIVAQRDNSWSATKLAQETAQARLALAANPDDPIAQARVQALEGSTTKPMSQTDVEKIRVADEANFIKFAQAFPMGTSPDVIREQYSKLKRNVPQAFTVPSGASNDVTADEWLNQYLQ